MLHYHVWFNLKSGITESQGLNTVKRFLQTLCADGEALWFELLRNHGEIIDIVTDFHVEIFNAITDQKTSCD